MKTVPIYVESPKGHDTLNVPEDKVQEEVEKQLKDGKWVTTESEGGSTEILTEGDMPKSTKKVVSATAEKSDEQEWADKFEKLKSATATSKAKGG